MTAYIDGMVNHGKHIGRAGPSWCHLVADTLPELHKFAQSIGLQRSWFQEEHHVVPHYDIGSARIRNAALLKGAEEVGHADLWRHGQAAKV